MIGRDLPSKILENALDAASLRQRVLAHNIANVNTPGFKRSRVDFEAELARAVAGGEDPEAVRPVVVEEVDSVGRPDGNNVDIEAESVKMAENQIWYAALTRQISDHFSRLRMVIHDGRR
ncbi:MAG: flagellar basal body rod protein FlgB [Bacillota bacterium]